MSVAGGVPSHLGSSATHAHSADRACSVLWDRATASAFGSASVARCWLAVEQGGPWGRDAARQSHLGEDLGGRLTKACTAAGGRFILIRRPGLHPDRHAAQSHRVYLGWSGTGPWLLTGTVQDPAFLLGAISWTALAAGDREAVVASWAHRCTVAVPAERSAAGPEESASPGASALTPTAPVLLVCTNAKRDVCCAVRGRPVAMAAAGARPGQVWECSHTGGHRFAPTGLILPQGQTYARLDAHLAVAAVDAAAAGQLPAAALGERHDRGRSGLDAPAQAAESHLREQLGELDLSAFTTTAAPCTDVEGRDAWLCSVRHRDGRSWEVQAKRVLGPELPASCGKAASPAVAWHLSTH